MSRSADIAIFNFQKPAAAAGTVTLWHIVPQTFIFTGFSWMYETTEANADNTFDFTIDSGTSATFTALHTNANAVGLLDSSAVLTPNTDKGNAAAGGGAAVAVTPTSARVAAGQVLRVVMVTAGTGTVPLIHLDVLGYFV